jgi:hypothetical protein
MINLDELAGFLARAKKATYAGNGREVDPERPGFKELEYIEGDWNYRDSYAGFFRAPGQEIVRLQNEPIWTMSYDGGMSPDFKDDVEFATRTFGFLKRALLEIPENAPYRGPQGSWNDSTGWVYENSFDGDLTDFRGCEMIWTRLDERSTLVFSQSYMGGLVIPKYF